MPFTLAHPAAVLPLRRFCPRFLCLPALVAGSLVPDVGYCFRSPGFDVFSHSFLGSFGFCLPVGLALLAVFYGLCKLTGTEVSEFLRPQAIAVILSLLIGAWTHILWDSFTNNHGWMVLHVAVLQKPLLHVARHQVRVCHLLWYTFSFVGVASLYLAYEKWKRAVSPNASVAIREVSLWKAVFWGLLVLPIGAVHHLVPGFTGALLVTALSALLVGGAVAFPGCRCSPRHQTTA